MLHGQIERRTRCNDARRRHRRDTFSEQKTIWVIGGEAEQLADEVSLAGDVLGDAAQRAEPTVVVLETARQHANLDRLVFIYTGENGPRQW